MKGKGEVLTYWLEGTTEQAIQKKTVDDYLKLKPLFAPNSKKLVVNSVEVSRRDRRSPRMSMISNDVRQSYRDRNTPGTPDSRRMSANARCHHDSGGDPLTGESVPEDYKVFNFDTKDEREKAWAAKLLAGSGRGKNFSHSLSLRGPHTGSSYTINSSNSSANNRLENHYTIH